MPLDWLKQTTGDWLHVYVGGESPMWDQAAFAANQQPGVVSRVMRGHKSRTTAAMFNEMAAALQFPWYFGENWDAANDCLTDLDWLPAEAYILWISRAKQLLEHEPERELQQLFSVLGNAVDYWRKTSQGQSPAAPKPFCVVLQTTSQDESELTERLAVAKAPYVRWPRDIA